MMHQRIEAEDSALVVENMGEGVLILLQKSDRGVQNVVLTLEDLKRLLAVYR